MYGHDGCILPVRGGAFEQIVIATEKHAEARDMYETAAELLGPAGNVTMSKPFREWVSIQSHALDHSQKSNNINGVAENPIENRDMEAHSGTNIETNTKQLKLILDGAGISYLLGPLRRARIDDKVW